MKTHLHIANLPPSRAQRAEAGSRVRGGGSLTLSTTFVFMALAAFFVAAFGGGWLLRGRQLSRAQAHASPAACLAEPPGDSGPIMGADMPTPRLSPSTLAPSAPAEFEREPMPAREKVSPPAEPSEPLAPMPDLTPERPLGAHEVAALSEKERGAVLEQAQLEPTQIQVFDDQIRRLNERIEDWLTDYEDNVGKLPGDRAAASSRDFMMGVLTYVTQAQGELTSQLGDRFEAAAQAVDFDLSSQIDSHLIERLASVARPRT